MHLQKPRPQKDAVASHFWSDWSFPPPTHCTESKQFSPLWDLVSNSKHEKVTERRYTFTCFMLLICNKLYYCTCSQHSLDPQSQYVESAMTVTNPHECNVHLSKLLDCISALTVLANGFQVIPEDEGVLLSSSSFHYKKVPGTPALSKFCSMKYCSTDNEHVMQCSM